MYVVLAVFLILGNIDFTDYAWTQKEAGTDRDYLRTLNIFIWIVVPLTGLYAFLGMFYSIILGKDIVTGIKDKK